MMASSKPEDLWGYDMVSANYKEEPSESRQKIYEYLSHNYPFASGLIKFDFAFPLCSDVSECNDSDDADDLVCMG